MEVSFKKSAKGVRWTPSSSSSSCFITKLPTPILMEILCRLPIKTLIASKSVCKSWLHLSRDPHFAQLHQANAATEVCFQLRNDEDTLKLHMGNFHCLNNFDPRDVKLNTLFELPKLNALKSGTVVVLNFSNSCNGLLCYNSWFLRKFVVVWNPCTYITLPEPPLPKNDRCRYGLGFSRKTNKYKLLRLVHHHRERMLLDIKKDNVVAEILTIEKGCSWNTLGPCPSYVWKVIRFCNSSRRPAFLHGTLHWLDIRGVILTFDFEDEQFGRVPLPPFVGNGMTPRLWRIGELSGCLFITEYTGEGINIWLMKEYGVQDSWTKMYSLPCIVDGERISEKCIIPVTCMDNGEILLACSKVITSYSTIVFSYNPDLQVFRRIGSGRGDLRVIPYMPSLVPLKDSMFGYKVYISASKHKEMSKSPDWWTLLTKHEERRWWKSKGRSNVLINKSLKRESEMNL